MAALAVPFLLLALIAVVVVSLQQTSFSDLVQISGEGMDMPTAISAVVGAASVGVVLTPDGAGVDEVKTKEARERRRGEGRRSSLAAD